jgi:NADH-quinone oxidoreductase subunit G
VAAAHEDTIGLGDLMGDITVEKLTAKQLVAYQAGLKEAHA